MSWTPFENGLSNFEDEIYLSNGLKPTFQHYAEQDDYGLQAFKRPKNTTLDVDEEVYEQQSDGENLANDAKAELELKNYCKKFGNPNKNTEKREWDEHSEHTDDVDNELRRVIRDSGIEPEPNAYFRPNSNTTSKSAIPINQIPVVGVKNLYLTDDHFKFDNPYCSAPVIPNPSVTEENESENKGESKSEEYSRDESSTYSKTFKEPTVGVSGEQYVSPAQLYLLKARRNR